VKRAVAKPEGESATRRNSGGCGATPQPGCDREAGPTGAVVLAAGQSRRLGKPKLLLPFGGSTVIGCVVSALEGAGLDPIVVVAGDEAVDIAQALRATRATIVRNPNVERGMISSVRIGVSLLPAGVGRLVLALGDQPRLRADDIIHLLAEHGRLGKGIAVACHGGKRGHPVVFDGRYVGEIMAVPDSGTLRDVIHAHADDVAVVEYESDAVISDIDTQEDYDRQLRHAQTAP